MSRTDRLARAIALAILLAGATTGSASAAITLESPAGAVVYDGTPGPVLAGPRVLTHDLSRDGRADAVAGTGTDRTAVALGTSDGLGPTATRTDAVARIFAVGDVTRDGRSDLIRVTDSGVTVAPGHGDGTFGAPTTYGDARTACAVAIATADVDRDGVLDVVVACPDRLETMRGDGAGGLAPAVSSDLGVTDQAADIALADMNRDGIPDVVVAEGGSGGRVSVLGGVGDGTFTVAASIPTAASYQRVAVADTDRDGKLDVIGLTAEATPRLLYMRGNGSGSFTGLQFAGYPLADAVDLVLDDLDLDGRVDLVVAGRLGITTLEGDGNSGFVELSRQTAAWATAVTTGDVDGDGRPDVVLLGRDGDLQVARNVSVLRPASNVFPRLPSSPATERGPAYATSADLNRDGIPDLIVAQQTASRVGVLLGNGDATFGARGDFWAGGSSPSQIVPADMNRDGIPDLVVGHSLGGTIGVLIGRGDGTFDDPRTQDMPFLHNAVGIAVGDFDRDGIPDVATANGDGQRVSVFRGIGDGTLSSPTTITTAGGNITAIVAGDFDRDGRIDLAAIGGGFSARLNLLRGNGDGSFQASTVNLASGSQPQAVRAVDLDRDGDLDLVIANHGNATVSVLPNVGGGFATRHDHAVWGTPRGLDVGDVHGDLIPDVVFSDGTGSTVGVLRGQTDGTFAAATSHAVGTAAYGVAVADLDRDGRSEIVAPGYTQQTIAVLLGTTDLQPPSTVDDITSGWSRTGRVTLTATDAGGVDRTYYTVGSDPADPTTASSVYSGPLTLTDGQRVKYFSVDHAGNAEPVRTSGAIRVDDVAPVSSASLPSGWQNAPVAVTLSATDAGSGVHRIYYTVGSNPGVPGPTSAVYDPASKPTLTHGQRIRFRAEDVAGNVEASKPAEAAVQVDTVAPVTSDNVTDAWRTQPVTVALARSDSGGSFVAATYYEIGTAPDEPTTASPVYDPTDRPRLNHGERIRYLTLDVAGNRSAVGISVAARVDGDPPATTDDVPDDWQRAPVPVTLDAADARSGVAATYYEIGVSPADPSPASPVYDPASKPLLQHGERIAYRSVDVAGNLEDTRSSAAARIDDTAPAAPTLLAGPPAADLATTASIAFAGEPDATFECEVDGGPAAPCSSPLVLRDLGAGAHTVRIHQIDVSGLRSPALTVTFTVTAPPVDPPPAAPPVDPPPAAPPVDPPVDPPAVPEPRPSAMRALLGDADGAGRRPVVLVAGQSGIACAADRGSVGGCRLEARSTRRLTTASGRRLPVGTLLAVGASTPGAAAGARLAADLRLTAHGRAARTTHPLGLTARLWVIGTTPDGAVVRGSSLIRLMTSDSLTIRLPGRSRTLAPSARLLLGRLVRTVGGRATAVRCTADTDASGDAAADRALTVAQARAACGYLASRGLRATRTVEGRGSTQPRASNRTDRGRALNRRLTIRIVL